MSDITPYHNPVPAHLSRREMKELDNLQYRGLVAAKKIEQETTLAALSISGVAYAARGGVHAVEAINADALLAAQRTPGCAHDVLSVAAEAERAICNIINGLGRRLA